MAKLTIPNSYSIMETVIVSKINEIVTAVRSAMDVQYEHDHTGNNGSDKGLQIPNGAILTDTIPDSKLSKITEDAPQKVEAQAIDFDSGDHADNDIERIDIDETTFQSAGYGILPAGAIIIWNSSDGSCPTGFARDATLDNVYLRGSNSYGILLGATTHNHSSFSHKHSATGNHTHTASHGSGHDRVINGSTNISYHTGYGGQYVANAINHSHNFFVHATADNTTSNQSESWSTNFNTFAGSDESNNPLYINVVFCKKV